MNIIWRRLAIQSLVELDQWRESIELTKIGRHSRQSVENHFKHMDYMIYIPGRTILIKKYPVNFKMALITVDRILPAHPRKHRNIFSKTPPSKTIRKMIFRSPSFI